MVRNKRSLMDEAAASTRAAEYNSKRQRLSTDTRILEDNSDPSSSSPVDSPISDTSMNEDNNENDNDDGESIASPVSDDSEDTHTQATRSPTIQNESILRLTDEEAARLVNENRRRNLDRNQPNIPAENAIIEEVYCTNFMCHSSLKISLGPLINFIIGHNGSGKSAILTALVICLGGKATATNRGASLKTFVKTGSEKCTIRVKIKNQGQSAFRHDVYGDSISVERFFFASTTTSGFIIRNANGIKISTKRADVDDILDFFGLQLDNPMNVLTQDSAREFLNSSSSKDKYKLFSKGTHLEQLDHDYAHIERSLENNEQGLNMLREQVHELKRRYEIAKKQSECTTSLRKITDELNRLRNQMCWVQVQKQEQRVEKAQDDVRVCQQEIQTRTEEFENCSQIHAQCQSEKENADAVARKIAEEDLEPLNSEKAEFSADFDANKEELQNIVREERELQTLLAGISKASNRLNDQIMEERRKLEQSDSTTASLHQKIQEKKQNLETCKAFMEDLTPRIEQATNSVRPSNDQRANAKKAVEDQEHKVNICQTRIRDIQRQGGKVKRSYQLQQLLVDIDRNTWKEKPLGPISDYVFLKEAKWSPILEKSFGAVLNAFVVTNYDDQKKLSTLIQKSSLDKTDIIVGKLKHIDTTGREPSAEFLTWLRVLNITNDFIRAQLIIKNGIEKTVLIEKRDEGHNLIQDTGRSKNIAQIFTFTDDQTGKNRGAGVRIANGASGTSLLPITPWNGPVRMSMDMQAQLNLENDALEAHKLTLNELQAASSQAEAAYNSINEDLNRLKYQQRQKNRELDRIDDEIQQLQDQLEEATPQQGKIEQLEKEREKKNQEIIQQAETQALVEDNRRNKDAISRDLRIRLKDCERRIAVVQKTLDDANKKVLALQRKSSDKLYAKNEAAANIRHAESEKDNCEQEYTKQKTILDGHISQALTFCERVPIPERETHETLRAKYQKLQTDLERSQAEAGGTEEQLKEREVKAKEDLESRRMIDEDQKQLSLNLKQSLKQRRDRWIKFRDLIAMHSSTMFQYLLHERSYRGSLEFDHAAKELDMHIEPDETRKSDAGRQTKTLSGGEKSFSQICLLLSLWNAMGSPIRCLDEFDVFMDNVNRDISVKMLIDAARQQTSRQFVLITPQSMTEIPMADDVQIHKMKDPERSRGPIDNFVRS